MTQAKSKATTVSTPQTRTTPKDKSNSPGPPVGLIVAPILLCVLIAALIFLWIKYKKREKRRKLRRQLRSGDTESPTSATTPGANSTHPIELETNRPLLSTSAFPSEEPVPSPGSASESVAFSDEQSEKGQNLDPIEEREDNQESRVHSARPVQASGRVQRLVQEECAEPVENQDPSESGGEPEEEEPQSFRDRRFDSGYRSQRTRPYYRDSYGRFRPHLRPLQVDDHSSNGSDEDETEPKQVVPSRNPPPHRQYTDPKRSQQNACQESRHKDDDDDDDGDEDDSTRV